MNVDAIANDLSLSYAGIKLGFSMTFIFIPLLSVAGACTGANEKFNITFLVVLKFDVEMRKDFFIIILVGYHCQHGNPCQKKVIIHIAIL